MNTQIDFAQMFRNDDGAHAVDAGTKIFSEGDPGDSLYVILDGEVDILDHGRRVQRLRAGDAVVSGQKADISRTAKSGTSRANGATAARQSPPWAGGRCTISGWSLGRPLASKMPRTALALPASAARPYTVSVGMPTRLPAASRCAACSMAAGSRAFRVRGTGSVQRVKAQP